MRFPWNLRDHASQAKIQSEADALLLFLNGDAARQARANALECRSKRDGNQARHWAGVGREIERRFRLRETAATGQSRFYNPDQLAMRDRLIELCKHASSLCNDGFTATRFQHACAITFQIEHHTNDRPEMRAVVREMIGAMEALRGVEPPTNDGHYGPEAMSVMRRLLLLKDLALGIT